MNNQPPQLSEIDRLATVRFFVLDTLVGHCGEQLTPDLIDEICLVIMDSLIANGTLTAS